MPEEQRDSLGLTELENKQIDALSLGATREEVANLSRMNVEDVPEMILPSSDEEYGVAPAGAVNEYEEDIPLMPKKLVSNHAIYAALASGSPTPVEVFDRIHDELGTSSYSPTYRSVQDQVSEDAKFELEGMVEDSAIAGDVTTTQSLLQAAPQLLNDMSSVRTAGVQNASEMLTAPLDTPRAEEHQRIFLESLDSRAKVRTKLNQIIDRSVADSSTSVAEFSLDMADTAIVGEQLPLSRVANEILGEHYFVLGGDMTRDLAQWVTSQPEEEQEAAMQRVVDSYTKHAGLLPGQNDAVKVFALESLREYINSAGTEEGGIPWNRYIDNVFGVVDIVPLIPAAALARGAKKLLDKGKVARSSGRDQEAVQAVTEANPDVGAAITADAIKSERAADKLGTTQADATASTMPHGPMDTDILLEGAPRSVVDRINGTKTKAEEATTFVDNTFLYADKEYKNKITRTMDILDSEKVQGFTRPSISTMARDPNSNSIDLKVTYGDNTDLPLTELSKAEELADHLRTTFKDENQDVIPVIQVKDDTLGVYEPYDPAVHQDAKQFYVTIDTKMPMQYTDILPTEAGQQTKSGTGVVKRWLMDPNSWVDRNVLGAARIANERKAFSKRELVDIARPFTKLSWKGKRNVADLMKRGEEEQTVFSWDDLRREYSNDEIEAYYSMRIFNDAVYRVKNQDLRDKLKSDGYMSLKMETAGGKMYENAVRPLEIDKAKDLDVIYDVKAGTRWSGSVEDLYGKGLQVGQVLRKVDNGNSSYSYVVLRPGDVSDLPKNVVPYTPGYNFRINTDPYYVDEVVKKTVDGKATTVTPTIGSARSAKEAQRYIDKLKAANPNAEYQARVDRNVSSVESMLANDIDMLDGSGPQFWFSKRGDRLTREDGSLSAVEDPIAALHQLASSVSNVQSHRNLIEVATQRHQKTFANVKTPNGDPIWAYDANSKQMMYQGLLFNDAGNPALKAANAEYNYIQGLKNMPTAVDKIWTDTLLSIDTMFAKAPLPKAIDKMKTSFLLDFLQKNPPGSVARGAAFALSLPLRPIKQLALQWSTGLHLFGINPKNTGKAFQDSLLTTASMGSWDKPALWKKTVEPMAKAMGYTPEEWRETFEAFRRTGKAYAIDSNVIISDANFSWARGLPETRLGQVGQAMENVARSPITIGKMIGFDLGELGNQAVAWHFARRQWEQANPGKSWKGNQVAQDEIAEAGRNFSVDMTRASAFPYQRGAFATMTQFMAINHKMLLKMLPSAIGGDPAFRSADRSVKGVLTGMRGKYIAGMMAMYGASGVGLGTIYDSWIRESGIDVPKELDNILQGGFNNLFFNYSLDLAFGDELGTSRVDFAGTFSPASGAIMFAPELIENMIDGNMTEVLAGASGHTFPRIGRAADHIRTVFGFEDIDTFEKFTLAAENALGEFGSFSDVFRYNMAMAYAQKEDELYTFNSKGQIGVPATRGELMAKMLFNLNLRNEGELFDVWLKRSKDFKSSGKKMEAQVDKDGKRMAEWLMKTWLDTSDPWEFQDKANSLMWTLHNGDGVYGRKVYDVAKMYFRTDPNYGKFVADIINREGVLDSEADINEMKSLVNSSGLISEQDKSELIRYIDELTEGREESMNFMKEYFDR